MQKNIYAKQIQYHVIFNFRRLFLIFAQEPLEIPQDSAVYIHHMADITSMQKPREMIAVYLLKECGFGLV